MKFIFEKEIESLNSDLLELFLKLEEQFQTIILLVSGDCQKEQVKVLQEGKFFANLDLQTKETNFFSKKVFWEITKQQLLAYDLRRMIFYLNVSFHLNRLTEYLKKIFLFFTSELNEKQKVISFSKGMVSILLLMMKQVFVCIKQFSSEKAIKAAKLDHEIDVLYTENIRNVVHFFLQKKNISEEEIIKVVKLLQVVKYFERWGDHLVNICEALFYAKTEKFVSLGGN